ncbi:MAG: polyprenol monophosphomannose synthase [Aigarchaeota archaeon]|nr:polyprenol monophosphomannose synthase [Aigarchaeota archaeon]
MAESRNQCHDILPEHDNYEVTGLTRSVVCVVIPTLNESGTIGVLIESLEKLRDFYQIRIIIVDDGSTDGTIETVRESSKKYGNLTLIERDRKLGLGNAIRTGIRAALDLEPILDFIVTMDADLSHDPNELPKLVEACEQDFMVVGSRYVKGGEIHGWGLYRKTISKGANILARALTGISIKDCSSGFRCYSADLMRDLLPGLKSIGYDIQIEILSKAARHGFKMTEKPITFRNRASGESKLRYGDMLNFVKRVFILFRETSE